MAATGKKSKKMKGKTLGIKDFLADTPIAAIQLQSKNWAEDEEDYGTGGYASRTRMPVVLPTASRSSRDGIFDDDSAPHYPPFMAYLSNLPYEVEDPSIAELFPDMKVINLRLPREMDGRSKGFGYVEFEDRESLVNAVNIHDLQLSGRRIRIDVAEAGDKKFGGRRSDRDREREYDPERTAGDWRAGPRVDPEGGSARKPEWSGSFQREGPPEGGGAGGGSSWREARQDGAPSKFGEREPFGERSFGRDGDRDRGFGGDRDRGFSRDGERNFSRDGDRGFGREGGFDRDRGFSRDGDRDRGFGREGDRDRGFGGDRDRGFGRDGERDRGFSRDGDRNFGRDGDRSFSRDGDRNFGRDGDRYGYRREGGAFGRSYGGERDREERSDAIPATRPKLNLLPRTVPTNPTPPAADGDDKLSNAKKDDGDAHSEPIDSPDSSRDRSESGKRASSPDKKPAYKPPVPASSIFGAARPVDTSAREREIEERLMKKAEEMRLRDGPKDREEKWRDRKDDFGGAPKRSDDRGSRLPYRSSRDSKEPGDREFNDRDSKGYRGNSRDNKVDSRDYKEISDHGSRDRREKRDSRDSRDGGPPKSSRDNSRDNRDQRESRPIVRNSREYSGSRDAKEAAERDSKEGIKKERSYEERPMPKAKEHEPPNFIAQNKFSYLENDDDDVSE